MKLWEIVFGLAIICVVSAKVRFDYHRVYEVFIDNSDQLVELQNMESSLDHYIFWESPVQTNMTVRIVVPPHKVKSFEGKALRLNLENTIVIDNVQEVIDNERPSRRKREGFGWEDYYTLDEMYAWFDELVSKYGTVLKIEQYGKSYEGRDMKALVLSKKTGNPGIFLESNIHAREWITSATTTWILNELLTSNNPAVQQLAEKFDWYILPVVNPDGLHYTKKVNRMWRKNRKPHSLLCYGVDLNRNFPGHWMEGGASLNPCTDIFAGPEMASEIETQNVMNYFLKNKAKIDLYLSFHSYGQYMLLPYGFQDAEKAVNYYDWMEMAESAAIALSKRYATNYKFGTVSDVLYVASGSSMDWAHAEHNVSVAMTYEFRDQGKYGFILPAEQIIPNAQEVLDSLIVFFERGIQLGYFSRDKTCLQ
ncbi:zinc carboxypeptidase-like isoform X3 [Malaya genurostris]|uniref:zinc carboxypeptidase-like isoform X3 n=1 Tax=Malaya genurostris TaxID=325434 RepID=UPI0026F3A6F2|nr:zinc carboxypeptidase-like isoform X3 [Malaya genurostris]XP_058450687.1 zinc carboxypeptidase-like isoform X3 [Malaya genurostris]